MRGMSERYLEEIKRIAGEMGDRDAARVLLDLVTGLEEIWRQRDQWLVELAELRDRESRHDYPHSANEERAWKEVAGEIERRFLGGEQGEG